MSDDRSDRFTMPAAVLGQCVYCRHFKARDGYAYCAAFPGGVPAAILANAFDHRRPHPDQAGGDLFTPRDDLPPGVLDGVAARLDEIGGPK